MTQGKKILQFLIHSIRLFKSIEFFDFVFKGLYFPLTIPSIDTENEKTRGNFGSSAL